MATLLLAKEVLQPVKRYIEIGQFDPGAFTGIGKKGSDGLD